MVVLINVSGSSNVLVILFTALKKASSLLNHGSFLIIWRPSSDTAVNRLESLQIGP